MAPFSVGTVEYRAVYVYGRSISTVLVDAQADSPVVALTEAPADAFADMLVEVHYKADYEACEKAGYGSFN